MAFIAAPGVAELRFTGKVGPNPWAVVLHWYQGSPSPWTQAQINALATAGGQHWLSNLVPLFSRDVVHVGVSAVDLSDSTERSAEQPPANEAGGTPSMAPTLGACILINHKIARRIRGGHPRTYLPPSGNVNTTDGDTWGASFVSTAQTNYRAFVTGINTELTAVGLTTPTQCAPAYTYTYTADNVKHKFIKTRTAFLGAFPISSSTANSQIATQRRRMGV